jgi:methyl coenzyme M reductase subunit C-like uncharacterized protein (methanogenesis marker protein 7)
MMTFNKVNGRTPTQVRHLQIILERAIDERDNTTATDAIRYRVVLVDEDNREVFDSQAAGSLIPLMTVQERTQVQAFFDKWWAEAQALVATP